MTSIVKALIAGIVAALVATSAFAQSNTDMQILADKLRADKKLLVSTNMQLTEAEAAKFWPIYDEYQMALQNINQQIGQLVGEYADAYNKGPVPNELSAKLVKEMLASKAAEVELMAAAAQKLDTAIPATKVARYLQIENKIRALINYGLAEEIPLIY
jgi:hypothetical protein